MSVNSVSVAPVRPRFVFLDAAHEVTKIEHPVHPRVETATLVRLEKNGQEVHHTAASDDGLVDALVTTFSSIFRNEYPNNKFPKVECVHEAALGRLCLRFKAHQDAPAHMKHATIVLRETYNPDPHSKNFLRTASKAMLQGIQTSYDLQGVRLGM